MTTVAVLPYYSQTDDRPPWTLYVQAPLEYFGPTDTDEEKAAALQIAYDRGQPAWYPGTTRLAVRVPLDTAATSTARWAMLKAAKDWVAASYGKIDLEIPDGLNRIYGVSIEAFGGENEFSICTTDATPYTVVPTSITYGTPVAGRVPVTVAVPEPLPSQVVVGYPIGTQAITGDNDAAAVTGGLEVLTIAGDRRSFTAIFWLVRNASSAVEPATLYVPVSPTVLTSATVNSVPTSRLVIPSGALGFEGGWVGAVTEGGIAARDGGKVRTSGVGLVYLGTDMTNGCLGFIKDPGSVWDSTRDVWVGGPEKVVRIGTDGKFTAQVSCFGGGAQGTYVGSGNNAEVINMQEGGEVWLVRCSVGGAKTLTVTTGNTSYANVNQSFLAGGTAGVRTTAVARADVLATRITHAQRGIYAARGPINLSATTSIETCYADIQWAAGGFVYVAPIRTNNYISAIGNILSGGGAWFSDVSKSAVDQGITLSPAPKDGGGLGGVLEAPLTGTGWLEIMGANANLMGTVWFTATTLATTAADKGLGSTFVLQTTEPTNLSNDGKVTIAIFVRDSASYLRVVNRTSASASLQFYVRGNAILGDTTTIYP